MIKIRIITEIGPFKSLIFKQVFIHQFKSFLKDIALNCFLQSRRLNKKGLVWFRASRYGEIGRHAALRKQC